MHVLSTLFSKVLTTGFKPHVTLNHVVPCSKNVTQL